MSLKYATLTKNENWKKKKRTRPKILGRNIIVCFPDSKVKKCQPFNTCETHAISTLRTWKIHGQLPKFGTQNFMVEYVSLIAAYKNFNPSIHVEPTPFLPLRFEKFPDSGLRSGPKILWYVSLTATYENFNPLIHVEPTPFQPLRFEKFPDSCLSSGPNILW